MSEEIDCQSCIENAEARKTWEPGPWQDEPDRVEFEHAGLPCILHRAHGHWCGYAAVPPGHPCHGKHYNDVQVEVHGGLTYAEKCSGHVCHVPKPGEPDDVFWFGFDCAHSGDMSPGNSYSRDGKYRDVEYVREQTKSLAEQLAASAK